MSKRVCH